MEFSEGDRLPPECHNFRTDRTPKLSILIK